MARATVAGLLALSCVAVFPVQRAEAVAARKDAPDSRPVGADEIREVVAELAGLIEASYVHPDKGAAYARALRDAQAAGRYADIRDTDTLARRLTEDLAATHKDQHLRVFPPRGVGLTTLLSFFGGGSRESVTKTAWLAPGVAYIEFAEFGYGRATSAAVERFLAEYGDAKAVVIDVRACRGGTAVVMDLLFPHLFAEPRSLLTMETRAAATEAGDDPMERMGSFQRVAGPPGIVRREHRVVPAAEPAGIRNAKIYYLTSARTASAAEHFALVLKRTGRGTIVGETTAGANHYGSRQTLPHGFGVFLPIGRTYNPDDGRDWEGVGVSPDVPAGAAEALDAALRLAAP